MSYPGLVDALIFSFFANARTSPQWKLNECNEVLVWEIGSIQSIDWNPSILLQNMAAFHYFQVSVAKWLLRINLKISFGFCLSVLSLSVKFCIAPAVTWLIDITSHETLSMQHFVQTHTGQCIHGTNDALITWDTKKFHFACLSFVVSNFVDWTTTKWKVWVCRMIESKIEFHRCTGVSVERVLAHFSTGTHTHRPKPVSMYAFEMSLTCKTNAS